MSVSGRSAVADIAQRLAEALQSLGGPVGVVEQSLDPAQVEAVLLELPDQPQLRQVLGAVVADTGSDLGRGEQPRAWWARMLRTDIPDSAASCSIVS